MDCFRVKDLIGYLNGLNKIFDIVRIVNPRRKQIAYQSDGGDNIIYRFSCYEYWQRGIPCDNCISTRAMREKKTVTKIEHSRDAVFVVIATPIIFGDDLYIVEMLKDITDEMFARELASMAKTN